MITQVAGKDGELKTVVQIDENSKIGRFTAICIYIGFGTLMFGTVKTITKIVNKITKKGA